MKYQLYLREPLPDDIESACETLAESFGMSVEQVELLTGRAPGFITKPLPLDEAEDTLDFVLAAGFEAELREAAVDEAKVSYTDTWKRELAPLAPTLSNFRGSARRAVLAPLWFVGILATLLYIFVVIPWHVSGYQDELDRYAYVFAEGVAVMSDGLPLSAPAIRLTLQQYVSSWGNDAMRERLAAAIIIDGNATYVGGFNETALSDAALVRERSAARGRSFDTLGERFGATLLVVQALTGSEPTLLFGSAPVPGVAGGQVLLVGQSEQAASPVVLGGLFLLAAFLFGMVLAGVNAAVLSHRIEQRR